MEAGMDAEVIGPPHMDADAAGSLLALQPMDAAALSGKQRWQRIRQVLAPFGRRQLVI